MKAITTRRSTDDTPALTQPLRARVSERELLRVAAALRGSDATAAMRMARDEVLAWAARQVGDQLPSIAKDGDAFEHLKGGRLCIGASFRDEHRALWALRVDRPDVRVAQRTWTTEVVIGLSPAQGPALFSLRLLASTPEVALPVEPAVPGLVRQVASTCGLYSGDTNIEAAPWYLANSNDLEALVTVLVDPRRTVPYVICTVLEGEKLPRLDARLLSKVTLGLAKVVVVPAHLTRELTLHLGKPLSTYNGAVRAYMPGFSFDANPYAHRLFLLESLSDENRQKSAATTLRWLVANESLRQLRLGEDVVAFSVVRESGLDFERERLKQAGSADTDQLRAAQTQIGALKDDLRRSLETQQWLSDEHQRIEERAQTLEQRLRGSQFRVQQLLEQIKARGERPDSSVQLPSSWDEFLDWSSETLEGRVALSARARREIKSAEYEDPSSAANCLLWLANEYRDSRMKGADGDLRKPIGDGIHNDRCGSDSFEFDWNDGRVLVEWHIKNGGNTRDPRRCLRIYYFWDDASQMVIVASMPAHLRTGAT